MKKLLIGLMALAGLSACTQVKETLTVTVSNSLPIERQGEMVEIPMDKVVKELGLADTAQVVVWDKDGVEYTECIVYRTEFRSPIFGGGAWNANSRYDWSWYLARVGDGPWELLTWGAP